MQIWFFLPLGALAPKLRNLVVPDPPDRPDLEPVRRQARQHLSVKLSPKMLKDVGLGDD